MRITSDSANSAGQLTGFGLHDSVLVGLSVEFDRSLRASFRRPDGSTAQLSLLGLGPVGAVALRNGAIVAEVFIWAPKQVPEDSIELVDGAWSVVFAGDIKQGDIRRVAERHISQGQFSWMVLIECSFGGSLAALCQQIEVS
jgi:hypothetical protein